MNTETLYTQGHDDGDGQDDGDARGHPELINTRLIYYYVTAI